MKVRKFFAPSSREALRMVREALGADAVVLTNRTVDGGVELTALAEDELVSLSRPDEAAARDGARRAVQAAQAPSASLAQAVAQSFAAAQAPRPSLEARAADAPRPVAGTARASMPKREGENALFRELGAGNGWLQGRASAPSAVPLSPANAAALGLGAAGKSTTVAAAPLRHALPEHERRGSAPLAPARREPGRTALPQTALPGLPPADGVSFGAMPDPEAIAVAPQGRVRAAPSATSMPVAAFVPAQAATSLPGQAQAVTSVPALAQAAAPAQAQAATPAQAQTATPVQAPAATPAQAPAATPAQAPAATPALAQAPANPASDAARADENLQLAQNAARSVAGDVMGELHSLRGMLETQLAGLAWSDGQRREPLRGELARTLIASGFSPQLAKLLLERLPHAEDHAHGLEWLKDALMRNLPVLDNEDALMERGGVIALMGPTGVGKTTTTAKLAARCVMRYGADRVALLTTDSYRIGAHEQLRIYGKILGVAVHAVKDAVDLRLALGELRNKHIVLIDTIGMSQRDRNVSEQVAMLCNAGHAVQRLLLLNATAHGDHLNEVVQAYRGGRGGKGATELAGCILTKLDEATNIGAVLDTVIRYQLPVHYVSTGQKVPENLYVARRPFLIKSAFCIPRERSPFAPDEEDLPALMSARATAFVGELDGVHGG